MTRTASHDRALIQSDRDARELTFEEQWDRDNRHLYTPEEFEQAQKDGDPS